MRGSELGPETRGSALGSLPREHALGQDGMDTQQHIEAVSDGPTSSQSNMYQPLILQLHVTHNPRSRRAPAHLEDYVCYNLKTTDPLSLAHRLQDDSSGTSYPIANYVTCTKFSIYYKNFLAAITKVKESKFYNEAAWDPRWRAAMEEEIQALENNRTRVLQDLPKGKKPISCK